MGRIRSIKPEFFLHEELGQCSAHARLLAIAMLTMADCEGRFRWIDMQVHGSVFPWEAEVNVRALLGELLSVHYCSHAEIDGKEYVEVENFKKHQRLSGKEAQAKSSLPSIKDLQTKNKEGSRGEAPSSSLSLLGTGEQGNSNKTPHSPPRGGVNGKRRLSYPEDYPPEFVEVRDAYPRREGGDPNPLALKAYRALVKDGWTHDRILEQVKRYAAHCQSCGKEGTPHVMQMASFFGPQRQGYAETWTVPTEVNHFEDAL